MGAGNESLQWANNCGRPSRLRNVKVPSLLACALGYEWTVPSPGHFAPQGKKPRYIVERRLGVPQVDLEERVSVASTGNRRGAV
jgi:hypothetical protein